MAPIEALIDLLGRVGACGGTPALVTDEELHQWHPAAVKALKAQGLISKTPAGIQRNLLGLRARVRHARVLSSRKVHGPKIVHRLRQAERHQSGCPFLSTALTQWRCGIEEVCGFVCLQPWYSPPQQT